LQVAGEEVIENWSSGKVYYDITKSTIDRINAFYGENIVLYDWNNVDTEYDDLLEIVQIAIQQYGCRFICLDNLMTAVAVEKQSELYNAQSNFVEKLCKIAKTYNVIILLVAHPRKTGSDEFTNDDISGSSDITKKADVVMAYQRIQDGPEDARNLRISKNRLTGKLTNNSRKITLHYSEKSKRIVGEDKNFGKQYLPELKSEEGFIGMEEYGENLPIPF
jgi:twinkle protein